MVEFFKDIRYYEDSMFRNADVSQLRDVSYTADMPGDGVTLLSPILLFVLYLSLTLQKKLETLLSPKDPTGI